MLSLPKVELHLHLDGSLRVETVLELAGERRVKLPTEDPEKLAEYLQVPYNCPTLVEYLKRFELPVAILQDEESLERVGWELVEDLKRENVCYGEIRYAPYLHLEKGMKLKKVVEAVLRGVNRAAEKLEVEVGVILCCMRHHAPEINKNVVRLAGDYLGGGVVAVDLAGDEANFPPGLQREVFTFARDAQIPYTIHAGEAICPEPEGFLLLLQEFQVKRIGHGVQFRKEPRIIDYVKEQGILLETCPTSNVQTKAVGSLADHPVEQYLEQGIRVTINTDNRTVSNTTLVREYQLVAEQFGFTQAEFKQMNLYAIDGAFTSKDVKDKVKEIIAKG